MLYETQGEANEVAVVAASQTCAKHLPMEAVLQCLAWLPGSHAHFMIATSCRTFQGVAKEDALWLGRLMQDFPRVRLQDKAPGSLYVTYKILAKAHRRHWQAKREKRPTQLQERSESWWQLMASRPEARKSSAPGCDARYTAQPAVSQAIAQNADAHSAEVPLTNESQLLGNGATRVILNQQEAAELAMHQIRARRREEPGQVAAVLEAQGGGVPRSVALFEGSLRAADLPASTFESIGTGSRQTSQQQPETLSSAHFLLGSGVAGLSCSRGAHGEASDPSWPEGVQHIAQDCHASSHVIQSIEHSERAAEIGEREAAEFAAVQHADFVERNLGRMPTDVSGPGDSVENAEQVILSKLNRIPKALRVELFEGASLRSCRHALEAAGHPWRHISGALLFVHPWQYEATLSALMCYELRPYHVVFAESFGYLLEEALARYKGSWMTTTAVVNEHVVVASRVGTASDAQSVDKGVDLGEVCDHGDEDEGRCELRIQRTFVCLVPQCTSGETHVTASTTDMHCSGSANPRIVASLRDSMWQS